MKVFQAVKRVLIGRKLESSALGETLLPKRIALPVFASDALSSVAYAPDEILISGDLAEVRDEILATRADAEKRLGWVFDTYLLRRR